MLMLAALLPLVAACPVTWKFGGFSKSNQTKMGMVVLTV
jgi:hypothetical protein